MSLPDSTESVERARDYSRPAGGLPSPYLPHRRRTPTAMNKLPRRGARSPCHFTQTENLSVDTIREPMHRFTAALTAALGAALVASPSGVDATVSRSSGLAVKKDPTPIAFDDVVSSRLLLGTLVQTHTDERVPLDMHAPSADRFARLLADRVTGERITLDPRLLELLRALGERHPGARIELVSGYRSPKLNEMLRKKGRHVASRSRHSLGHAVDFRILVEDPDEEQEAPSAPSTVAGSSAGASLKRRGIDPRILEREIRDLGWEGGIGVYPLATDWFVHADVGPRRRWDG